MTNCWLFELDKLATFGNVGMGMEGGGKKQTNCDIYLFCFVQWEMATLYIRRLRSKFQNQENFLGYFLLATLSRGVKTQ